MPASVIDSSSTSSSSVPTSKKQHFALACIVSSIICTLALLTLLHVRHLDLHVPLTYWGDALYFLAWAKGILQGHWPWQHPRLGMPLGADWRDFPLNITIEALAIRCLGFFTDSPGLAVNLTWILGTIASAASATYCLCRLAANRWIAATMGVVYALQPFTFYRGTSHFNLMFYLVPFLATGAVEIAAGPKEREDGTDVQAVRPAVYLSLACIGQGLSYIYNAFFAIVLLGVATILGARNKRRKPTIILGTLAMTIIGCAVAVNLSPNVVYWAQHGKNEQMQYKSPAQAEVYGLKLRHLLTPIPDNPFRPLRHIQQKIDGAGFSGEYENATSRLGTLGSIAFLFLIGWSVASCLRTTAVSSRQLTIIGAAAALTLSSVLLATVGGFGSLFNVFVAPDIRCYNRIVVFIDFFCLLALSLLFTRILEWGSRRHYPVFALRIAVVLVMCFGIADQAIPSMWADRAVREHELSVDSTFVGTLESTLPRDAMIFQLPFTDFPVDGGKGRMLPYDHSRAYINSSGLRFSWGGISGRDASEWSRQTAGLPVKEMLARLSEAGFAGIWIDRYGYTSAASPESDIASLLAEQPVERSDGRIAFFPLKALSSMTAPERANAAGTEHVELTFGSGFYNEEHSESGHRTWRWSMRQSTLRLRNPRTQPVTATLHMLLQTQSKQPELINISGPGKTDTVPTTIDGADYTTTVKIPAKHTIDVSFECVCRQLSSPGDDRTLYFGVINPSVQDK